MRARRTVRDERRRRVLRELEAGAVQGIGVDVVDGIVQAPVARTTRYGAVAQLVHLVQPAGLVARRHEECVGARLDLVREGIVEGQADAQPRRVTVPGVGEPPLVAFVATAEDDDLEVLGEKLRQGAARMSRPFCSARRVTMPKSGTRARIGRP